MASVTNDGAMLDLAEIKRRIERFCSEPGHAFCDNWGHEDVVPLVAEVERLREAERVWTHVDRVRATTAVRLAESQGTRIHELEAEVERLGAENERMQRERNVAIERMRTAEYRESLLKDDVERLRVVVETMRIYVFGLPNAGSKYDAVISAFAALGEPKDG